MQFNSEEQRVSLALELVNRPSNLVLNDLKAEVEKFKRASNIKNIAAALVHGKTQRKQSCPNNSDSDSIPQKFCNVTVGSNHNCHHRR